jgi:hypothetical protein
MERSIDIDIDNDTASSYVLDGMLSTDGKRTMVHLRVFDLSGDDALVFLTPGQVDQLIEDLKAVRP